MVTAIRNRAQTSPRRPLAARIAAFSELMDLVKPVPQEWLDEASKAIESKSPPKELECLPCNTYRGLATAWEKALKWTPGLDHALTCMLASISSVKSVGDQLWIKVIGPASCGKSVLCEAISVNKEYILAKSTIRGFHSGFKSEDGEDNSLVSKLYNKTLVTKDGDTLLQSPNLGQILAEARDLYDCTSRTHYRNRMSTDYSGVRMTWILCGTSSLRLIDDSELGERFLDCVIMEKIDDDLEDAVLWRVVNRAARNLSVEVDGKANTQYEPELAKAMQLTGGYVSWLRENASDVLSTIKIPREAKKQCTHLGKFVAHMRARPSARQEETAEREFGARLVSQHLRLAGCIALVLNRKSIDELVMGRVRQIALDTSRGQTLQIVKTIYRTEEGATLQGMGMVLGQTREKVKALLRFLYKIDVVKQITKKSTQTKWVLTDRMLTIYENVLGDKR